MGNNEITNRGKILTHFGMERGRRLATGYPRTQDAIMLRENISEIISILREEYMEIHPSAQKEEIELFCNQVATALSTRTP